MKNPTSCKRYDTGKVIGSLYLPVKGVIIVPTSQCCHKDEKRVPVRRFDHTLYQRRQMANKEVQRCSTSLVIRKTQIKITMRYHYTLIRILKVKHIPISLLERRNICSYKCLYMNIHGSFMCNSQTGNSPSMKYYSEIKKMNC